MPGWTCTRRRAPYFYQDLSEKIVKDRELLEVINQPNCMLTSHQAFLTQEALTAIAKTTLRNIREFAVDGKKMGQLTNSLNKKGKDAKDAKDGKDGAKGGGGKSDAPASGVSQHQTSAGSHSSSVGHTTGQSTDKQWAVEAVRAAVVNGQHRITADREPIKFASRL